MKLFKNLKNIVIIIAILLLGYFIYDKFTQKERIIEVPVEIEVPVPIVTGESDTITDMEPTVIVNPINKDLTIRNKQLLEQNKELLEKFKEADSIAKSKQYEEAIEIKEYNQTFTDTFQTVNVYSKTRGTLLEQSISYETKEYNIPLDTTITTKVKNRFKVFGSLELGSPLLYKDDISNNLVVKPGIIFKNSKDNGLSLSVDTRGYIWVGGIVKF